MRYVSTSDNHLLRRRSSGPVHLSARTRHILPVPGRGERGSGIRHSLRGFGAPLATGLAPPVGAGSGAGAEIGASQGASIGTQIAPGIGTAIGAVVGAIGGAIAGSINKKDPEQYNFDAAVALWQQNPNAVYDIGNKYLPIAGLFDLDLRNPKIPIYNRYNRKAGRGGEEKFADDLMMTIYQAAQSGRISSRDTALSVMANVVQPWIDSWGLGPMNDPHQDLINRLITGMTLDYVTGAAPQVWRARSGDIPASFTSIPAFSLPQPAQPAATAGPTPSPVATGGPETQTTVITANAPVVSTTPPAIGAPLLYAMDAATGKMMAVPKGATFGGLNPDGSWIIVYSTGQNAGSYLLYNGALTPSSVTAAVPSVVLKTDKNIPVPAAAATASAPAITSSPSSSGGGGGGFFPMPETSVIPAPSPVVSAAAAPDYTNVMLIGGAAVVLYLLLNR